MHAQVAALNAGRLSLPPPSEPLTQSATPSSPQTIPPVTSLDLYFDTLLSGFQQLTASLALGGVHTQVHMAALM